MLRITGDAKHADVVESALSDAVLAGGSLDGKRFFYTNTLRQLDAVSAALRWSRNREEWISCYCRPPNVARIVAQAQVAAAGPLAADTADRARAAVAAPYSALNAIHTERDKVSGTAAATAKADAAAKDVHARFVPDVSAVLTPAQVEAVKDHMTYGVLPTTLKAYREMLPTRSEPQLAHVRELLTAGRSEATHATFGRAKGRANNYLSAQGYDLKKAGEDWAARRRAAAATKKRN